MAAAAGFWAAASLVLLLALSSPAACCSGSSEDDRYRVIRKSDDDGKQLVVAVGDDARLSCTANFPWKRCVWKPPRNGVRELRCEFNQEKITHWSCPSFPEVHYDRENSSEDSCAIVVKKIQEHHEGNWDCEFELEVPDEAEPVKIKSKVRLMARGWRYP